MEKYKRFHISELIYLKDLIYSDTYHNYMNWTLYGLKLYVELKEEIAKRLAP